MRLQPGDVVAIDTPGGGGYGTPKEAARDAQHPPGEVRSYPLPDES